MNRYLITPRHSLGSDSFHVLARSNAEALAKALAYIYREDWHSPHGWVVMLEVLSFEDQGAKRTARSI